MAVWTRTGLLTGTYTWDPETLLFTYADVPAQGQLLLTEEAILRLHAGDVLSLTYDRLRLITNVLVDRTVETVSFSTYYSAKGERGLLRPADIWARPIELPEGRSPQIACVVTDVALV